MGLTLVIEAANVETRKKSPITLKNLMLCTGVNVVWVYVSYWANTDTIGPRFIDFFFLMSICISVWFSIGKCEVYTIIDQKIKLMEKNINNYHGNDDYLFVWFRFCGCSDGITRVLSNFLLLIFTWKYMKLRK